MFAGLNVAFIIKAGIFAPILNIPLRIYNDNLVFVVNSNLFYGTAIFRLKMIVFAHLFFDKIFNFFQTIYAVIIPVIFPGNDQGFTFKVFDQTYYFL